MWACGTGSSRSSTRAPSAARTFRSSACAQTAPIADPYGNDRIGLNLTTRIDRTDFGVDWNNPLPSGEPALANDVTILAELQFVKPGEETT